MLLMLLSFLLQGDMVEKHQKATTLSQRFSFQGPPSCGPRRQRGCTSQQSLRGTGRGRRHAPHQALAQTMRRVRLLTKAYSSATIARERRSEIRPLSSFVHAVIRVLAWFNMPQTPEMCHEILRTFHHTTDLSLSSVDLVHTGTGPLHSPGSGARPPRNRVPGPSHSPQHQASTPPPSVASPPAAAPIKVTRTFKIPL